jgi:hypothetical protein
LGTLQTPGNVICFLLEAVKQGGLLPAAKHYTTTGTLSKESMTKKCQQGETTDGQNSDARDDSRLIDRFTPEKESRGHGKS